MQFIGISNWLFFEILPTKWFRQWNLNTIAYAENTFFGVSDHIPITFAYSKNMTFGNEEAKLDM